MKKALQITDGERYQYLIDKAVETKTVWLLKAIDGMFAMFEDDKGQEYLPIWPEKEFTKFYVQDDWEEYEAEEMKIYEFLNWMQELSDDKILIAAFPDENNKVIPIPPLEIRKHLELLLKN
ncbi:MAG TPA: hypothetical protein DDX39_10105 [Bacteroidales bacterium]|nr:MAG: hypothetical protein A2W98_04340 [Bacteroidetes bacterium GWF2_33_38]OFY75463.1 MAG: hypothetical protein A2265_10435 [Bacteroidetes bacterium RIFOXYA12_FULL_33_9]OFY88404.1 MAG: hypothetical protein A2236_06180 [Bacteroidetes bacterium RIFOXYA2_FULL_33_7]HBF88981.1 hypothetical protein [Bacteroidales bacterium]